MKNKFVYIILFLIIICTTVFIFRDKLVYYFFKPRTVANQPTNQTGVKIENISANDNKDVEIVAQNLSIPWEIVFLPDGDMLVTERAGKLFKIGSETKLIQEIEGVKHIGEGGLLGMALHPNFATNNFIYLYSTTETSTDITNRVERYKFSNDSLTDRQAILEGIKGSKYHDGGKIAFGPDGYLYITTGDAQESDLAQDKNSLNGKILRIKDDGSIPADNPFGNAVYSLGHRNPQGLAWDSTGRLWQTEHGPSGSQTGYDEVNIIIRAVNYGWPIVKGSASPTASFMSPVIDSGAEDTWAPAGAIVWDNSLFFTGLRGEALYELKIKEGGNPELVTHFKQEFGRLRAVVLGPDGFIYVSTSNKDGRGQPKAGDDKIIKIDPKIFR